MSQPGLHKKIALYGGSFNPPHRAHRQVCEYLISKGVFDEVWMLVSFSHPENKELLSFSHRVEMCRLMTQDLDTVHVCNIEQDVEGAPTYTWKVIMKLKEKYANYHFSFVVGSDCQQSLNSWYRIEDLKKEISFFFVPRPGFESSPFMDISSSTIRQLIHDQKEYTKYLHPTVVNYIKQHHLY